MEEWKCPARVEEVGEQEAVLGSLGHPQTTDLEARLLEELMGGRLSTGRLLLKYLSQCGMTWSQWSLVVCRDQLGRSLCFGLSPLSNPLRLLCK